MQVKQSASRWSDRPLFLAFLALVFWAPLPFGSNVARAWAVLEVWVYVLAALWLFGYGFGRLELTPVFRKTWPVIVLFAGWLLYLALQIAPLPYEWVAFLSPEAARMHAMAALDGKTPAQATLSMEPHATAVSWLKHLAYALAFALALLLLNQRERVRQFAAVIVFSGLFQAVYGSLMTLSGLEYGFFYAKDTNIGLATGTFVSRNHFSGYLEMCLAVGIGLLIADLGGPTAANWRQRLRNFIQLLFSAKMRLRIYLAIMVIALVLSRSRMGNTAFFSSLIIAGLIGLVLSRHATRATVILLTSLIIIDLFIVGAWFGIEKVAQRIEETSFAAERRDEVDIYAYQQWKDWWLVGSGAGTFYVVFPRYRQGDIEVFFDHAHNDYFEYATETGVIGVAILGAIVVLSLIAALFAQSRRRDPLMRGMGFAATMGITAILIHSTVDFNLQIPANAFTFTLLLALGWIALHLRDGDGRRRNEERR